MSEKPKNNDLPGSQQAQVRAIEVLSQTQEFLNRHVESNSIAMRAGETCWQATQHSAQRFRLFCGQRPVQVCALVVGEFNAGKSTLINALVGRKVSETDVFVMTHAVCSLTPGEPGLEHVVLEAPGSNLAPLQMSLNEFLQRCRQRNLGKYTRAFITLPMPFDLMLFDTPGLGASLEHELEATNALGLSDIVLYVVSASDLGTVIDKTLLRRLRETGMPLLCILNKIDLLASDELGLAMDYIVDQFEVHRDDVFPVSAQIALTGDDADTTRLRDYLRTSVAPRGALLRQQARMAQAADIAKEMRGCIHQAYKSLETTAEEINAYRNSLLHMSDAVTEDMCHTLADLVRTRLKLTIETPLYRDMQAGKPISEAGFQDALRDVLRDLTNTDFLETLRTQVEQRFQVEWAEGLRGNIEMLERQLEELRTATDQEATTLLQGMLAKEEQKQQMVTEVVNGIAISVVAGLITVHPFIGIVGAGAAILYNRYRVWQHESEKVERERQLQETIQKWREEMVDMFVWKQFEGKLRKLNHSVVEEAIRQYALHHAIWPLPLTELRALQKECKSLQGQLDSIAVFHQN